MKDKIIEVIRKFSEHNTDDEDEKYFTQSELDMVDIFLVKCQELMSINENNMPLGSITISDDDLNLLIDLTYKELTKDLVSRQDKLKKI